MDPTISSKTGDAKIKKQGHTTNGQFGTDVNASTRGISDARELNLRGK